MSWATVIAGVIGAGASVYAANNAPKMPGQQNVVGAQGAQAPTAANVFSIDTPQKAATAPAAVTPGPADPMIQQLLQLGPPRPGESAGPSGPPAKLADLNYTAGANGDPYSAGPPKPAGVKGNGITASNVMQAIPEALAAVAPLLMMANQQQRGQSHVIGAQGGGNGGQMVNGLNLPRRQTMAEILASLPRPRYG